MSDNESLQQMANRIVREKMQEFDEQRAQRQEAERLAALPAPELRLRILETALACGARQSSVRHVVRDGCEIFVLQDGHVVPRDGRRNAHDPVALLDLVSWLADLRQSEPELFEPAPLA